jgi:hypothetical protein
MIWKTDKEHISGPEMHTAFIKLRNIYKHYGEENNKYIHIKGEENNNKYIHT